MLQLDIQTKCIQRKTANSLMAFQFIDSKKLIFFSIDTENREIVSLTSLFVLPCDCISIIYFNIDSVSSGWPAYKALR